MGAGVATPEATLLVALGGAYGAMTEAMENGANDRMYVVMFQMAVAVVVMGRRGSGVCLTVDGFISFGG
jgi:hypothetical protein